MRSATSSFKTLLRSDWKRGWPLCFLYTFILFFIVTIPTWNAGRDGYYYGAEVTPLLRMNNQIYDIIPAMAVYAMIMAAGVAMFLFAYLMKANSVGLMHAMPVTRGQQFAAHFTAGMTMLTAGNVLIFLLTTVMETTAGGPGMKPLLIWLVFTELEGFFFLAFATLCAMVTGWTLAVPVIYVGVNFMVLAYRLLLGGIASTFYRGYGGSDDGIFESIALWCTPVVKLVGNTDTVVINTRPDVDMAYAVKTLRMGAWKTVLIYTVAGIVMLVAAYLFYRARHSETADSAIVFPWLRPVVRYVISVAGGLALGMLVYALISDSGRNLAGMVVCQVIMGALVYCAVEMLLRKTFKIFDKRSAVGLVVLVLIIALIPAAVKLDAFGYQRRIPQAEQVQAVEISGSYFNYTTSTDAGTIADALALHKLLIDRGERDVDYSDSDYGYYNVRYVLNNGQSFRRAYSFYDDDGEINALLEKLVNRPEVRMNLLMSDHGRWGTTFTGGYVNNWMTGRETVLSADQCAALYRAAEQDAQTPVSLAALKEQYYTGTRRAQLEIVLTTTEGQYAMYDVTVDNTHVLALLQEYGVFEKVEDVLPREDGSYYYEPAAIPAPSQAYGIDTVGE